MRRLLSSLFLCLALPAGAQEFTTYKGHGGPVMALDVSPDGALASASFDNSVGLWRGQVPRWLEGHDAAVTALAYDHAPALLTGGDDYRVLLWHPDHREPAEVTQHQGKVSDIAVSPNGEVVASASWDGSVRLSAVVRPFLSSEALAAPKPPIGFHATELLGHRSNVTAVAFTPSGGFFSASSDGTIRVWEGHMPDLTPRTLIKHGFGVNRMIVTDTWIAYGAVDGTTRVIDPDSGAQIADFTLDRRPILSMDYHAATGQLAIGDGEGYIMMVDTNDWRITRDFRAMRAGPVWALAFSQDGNVIHAGGIDDVIYAWPVALLDTYDPVDGGTRSFLRNTDTMSNGERQFMRKCSICHSLEAGPSRKAGPTLHGVFGRRAGSVPDYRFSPVLDGSVIVWDDTTIDALFDEGPDHYIPGSKMPMQVIAQPQDRADLIAFLRTATNKE